MARGKDEKKEAPKPILGTAEGEYVKLIRKRFDKNLVGIQDEKPPLVNELFVVPKGEGKPRLITEGRPPSKHYGGIWSSCGVNSAMWSARGGV